MNNKRLFVLVGLLGILGMLAGCEERSYEAGPDMLEEGIVVETLHVPSGSDSTVSVGITTNGDLSINPVTVHYPETWAVSIKCQHGKFNIGSNTRDDARTIWENVVVGDKVAITYHEVFLVVKEDNVVKSRTFAKYTTTNIIRK